jgi:hypothetical protein
VTETSRGSREWCDIVTVGGALDVGNQSGVRVCDSIGVPKPSSRGISELEGHIGVDVAQ